jgi:hypothetical protein
MNIQFTMPEQPREHGQCVTGQRLIDKWLLTFQRFRRTATRSGVFVECSVRDLRKEFAGRAKPLRTPRIALVPWLAQDELAAIGAVSKVEPVRNARISANQLVDACAGRPGVHTTDNDVSFLNLL